MSLAPCPHCRRHVRIPQVSETEPACAFCGAELGTLSPIAGLRGRAKRIDVLLFATTLAATGCGGKTTDPPVDAGPVQDSATVTDVARDTELGFEVDPVDTAPPQDDGGPVPVYGAAPFQ